MIAGGGHAGLAAVKRLVDAGYRVEVREQRPLPGGKVSSWRDADGDWVESGLHVFFGAYVEIFDLLRELSIAANILWKEHVLRSQARSRWYGSDRRCRSCRGAPHRRVPHIVAIREDHRALLRITDRLAIVAQVRGCAERFEGEVRG